MLVCLRWVTEDFQIQQRLVALVTLANHMTGVQIASFITQIILTRFKLLIPNILCFNRDSCAANGVAARVLLTTFNYADDILCFCHTLCNMGAHFSFPLLAAFMGIWIKLV